MKLSLCVARGNENKTILYLIKGERKTKLTLYRKIIKIAKSTHSKIAK